MVSVMITFYICYYFVIYLSNCNFTCRKTAVFIVNVFTFI